MFAFDAINILGILSTAAIMILGLALFFKMERLKQTQELVKTLQRSLDEMDEQAKLIVRTDMELNKTQEELDKKVNGLYALQRLSRALSTTFEEEQIFQRIEADYLESLGFEHSLAFLWNEKEKKFALRMNIGYSEEEAGAILASVSANQGEYLELMSEGKTLSSLSLTDSGIKETIPKIFKTSFFVLCPLIPQEGGQGFFFVGTKKNDTVLTEGDEELITILTNHLGQALETARLFEKNWRAQQELEKKVELRTRELSLALEKVEVINRRKSDFISSVSHELRTPLTSIKGYASILLAGKLGEVPLPAKERLEKINRHSDELVTLVNDLLDIARIESGRVAMKKEQYNLREMTGKVLDILAVQLKERGIGFSQNIPSNITHIFADRPQMERVFINLINNAMKFTPANGKINVTACHTADKGIQIDITDTGSGIALEDQKKIFEEFYRVDNAINQQVKGTGLGLSLVKHIVEAHGGKIWVTSSPGCGATFSFTVPAA